MISSLHYLLGAWPIISTAHAGVPMRCPEALLAVAVTPLSHRSERTGTQTPRSVSPPALAACCKELMTKDYGLWETPEWRCLRPASSHHVCTLTPPGLNRTGPQAAGDGSNCLFFLAEPKQQGIMFYTVPTKRDTARGYCRFLSWPSHNCRSEHNTRSCQRWFPVWVTGQVSSLPSSMTQSKS